MDGAVEVPVAVVAPPQEEPLQPPPLTATTPTTVLGQGQGVPSFLWYHVSASTDLQVSSSMVFEVPL